MENNSQDFYLIDLSYALSPADIVFELSTILEQEMAHNQKVYLKLGNVDLNQSQLLSIKSLINSINSTLNALSSESKQTELAAATIGLNVSVKEREEDPSAQYIPMTEHLEKTVSDEMTDSGFEFEVNAEKETQEIQETETVEEKENNIGNKALNTVSADEQQEPVPSLEKTAAENEGKEEVLGLDKESAGIEETETQNNDNSDNFENSDNIDSLDEKIECKQESVNIPPLENEEIQAQLDSIFNSETKLENILAEQENYPFVQEAVDIEIPEEEELTEEDYQILTMPTKYVKQTIRSGQVIKFDGNIIVIGDCHPGSELHAAGDITVWGTLGGIAHAGCEGNRRARIRALQLNAIQLRIGEFYARRPDALNVAYIDKTNSVTPEEARIINDNIVILKLTD